MNTHQETTQTGTTGSENESGITETPQNEQTVQGEINLEEAIHQVDADHIQKLEAEISIEKDKLLRLFAEFENYKKRTIREKTDWLKTAGQEMIISLLPVLDDFDRAIKNVATIDPAVKEGLLLIHQKLKTTLEQKGLSSMESIGKTFDTDLHEAITNIPAPDNMKGKVMDEAEKGYYLNGKVIRHAKVVVGN